MTELAHIQKWALRSHFVSTPTGHVCKETCRFDNIVSNVWGCKLTGAIHECGEDDCQYKIVTHQGTWICKLTGTELGQVLVYDQFSCTTSKLKGDNPINNSFPDQLTYVPVIQDVVYTIMNSPKRTTLDTHTHERAIATADSVVSKWYKTMEGMTITVCDIAREWINAYNKRHVSESPPKTHETEQKLDELVYKIRRMWSFFKNLPVIERQPQRVGVKTFSIGILYILARGTNIEMRNFIEKDEWVAKYIPPISELHILDYDKSCVTVVRRWVQKKTAIMTTPGHGYKNTQHVRF